MRGREMGRTYTVITGHTNTHCVSLGDTVHPKCLERGKEISEALFQTYQRKDVITWKMVCADAEPAKKNADAKECDHFILPLRWPL